MVYHKYETQGRHTYVYLNDGTSFYVKKGTCIDLVVDVNGDRKPNKFGRDMFTFFYCPENQTSFETGKITTYKLKNKSRNQVLNDCKNDSYVCSGLLAIDGWQFKDDYPYHI